MTSLRPAARAAVRRCARRWRRTALARKALSRQADHLRRAVRRRQRHRPARARARPVDHRRRPSRRWSSTTRPGASGFIARAAGRGSAPRRRLHGADHHQHHARGQRAPVQEAALRPGEGLRAGHRPRQGRPDHGRAARRRRTRPWPSSSRSRRRSPGKLTLRQRQLVEPRSPASCSSRWPASSCCTCRTRATRSRSPTCSAARST